MVLSNAMDESGTYIAGNTGIGTGGNNCLTIIIARAPAQSINHLVNAARNAARNARMNEHLIEYNTIAQNLQAACRNYFHQTFGHEYKDSDTKPSNATARSIIRGFEDFVSLKTIQTQLISTYIKQSIIHDVPLCEQVKEMLRGNLEEFITKLLSKRERAFAFDPYEQFFDYPDQQGGASRLCVQAVMCHFNLDIPDDNDILATYFFMYFCGVGYWTTEK